MATTDFWAHLKERYYAECARGEHDDKCEVIPEGFWLCNCDKRARLKKGHTKVPGRLWYSNPTCPRCHNEVQHNGDSWECEECHVIWSPDDQDDPGEFTDDHGDVAGDRAAWLERHPDIARQMMSLADVDITEEEEAAPL